MKSKSVETDALNHRRMQGRRESRLHIAWGKSDPESLRSAVRTWIVPLLVRQFMNEQGFTATATEVDPPISAMKPLGKEDAGVNRVN